MKLERADVALLLEALKAWEAQPESNALISSTMLMAMSPNGENTKAKAVSALDKAKIEAATRSERSILLKAKLLQLRDSLELDEVIG